MSAADLEESEAELKSLVQDEVSLLRDVIATEDVYIETLRTIVEDYMPLFTATGQNEMKIMKKLAAIIFGATEDVYIYHTNVIYPEIMALRDVDDKSVVGKFTELIVRQQDAFDPYGFYVQGRPASKMLLAYNLGQHRNLKLIDDALQGGNKTRSGLEKLLQEPINRIKEYAKVLAKVISKTPLDDPNIDSLSLAFGTVDLEDEYKAAVTAWAAERIRDCPVELTDLGELLRYDSFQYTKDNGEIKKCCLFFFTDAVIVTTPELYDLPPEEHSKELTFLHHIPLRDCEIIASVESEEKFDMKVLKPDGKSEVYNIWATNKKHRNKWMKRLAKYVTANPQTQITIEPKAIEENAVHPPPADKLITEEPIPVEPKETEKVDYFLLPARGGEAAPIVPEAISEDKTEILPEVFKQSPFAFWKETEEKAKALKGKNPKGGLQFKYGQDKSEEERKARAFKLKESSRFKFWKLKEQEMKEAEKKRNEKMQKKVAMEKNKTPETNKTEKLN